MDFKKIYSEIKLRSFENKVQDYKMVFDLGKLLPSSCTLYPKFCNSMLLVSLLIWIPFYSPLDLLGGLLIPNSPPLL